MEKHKVNCPKRIVSSTHGFYPPLPPLSCSIKPKGPDSKVPKGPRRRREIPLIGVADVSLRGLGSPKEGEQKTFWSPSLAAQPTQKVRMTALILFEELTAFDFLEY